MLRSDLDLLKEALAALSRTPPKLHVVQDHLERVVDDLENVLDKYVLVRKDSQGGNMKAREETTGWHPYGDYNGMHKVIAGRDYWINNAGGKWNVITGQDRLVRRAKSEEEAKISGAKQVS